MRSRVCLLILSLTFVTRGDDACNARQLSNGNTICVCNITYCDTVSPPGTIFAGQGIFYQSSSNGKRFEKTSFTSTTQKNSFVVMTNSSNLQQTIIGFGGAFTDAVGINLMSLPTSMQQTLISSYYHPTTGIGYTIGRVPMASCDFSTHEYSYDDVDGDFSLSNFNLTMEDFTYKIPFIKMAQALVGSQMKLFSTPWAAPGWMKTNGEMRGGGRLKGFQGGPYYTTWANYFVRFFEEYHKNGVDFWGMTIQNEPTSGLIPNYKWQTMYLSAAMERDFLKNTLGPTLHKSDYSKNLKVMILDDQRVNLPLYPKTILSDPIAAQYVAGIAVHWYDDYEVPKAVVGETHEMFPKHFILATEACTGYLPGEQFPKLGDWTRGQEYAHDIITDLDEGVSGWTDWNLCLDLQGGPNWVKNFVDSPIIVNATSQEFYKNPMFYVMAHFSKFMVPGSSRIDFSLANAPDGVDVTAFLTPDKIKGVVVHNTNKVALDVSVVDSSNIGKYFNVHMDALSIVTILFN